ncbi:MAG: phosphotransferase family protein [Lachnospiraceae bacterium]|nr:phosphotransferase family protein [Lachnospiraceae bacterium]
MESNEFFAVGLPAITGALQCHKEDVKYIDALKKGMTNHSYLFSVRGKKYILRIPGEGTDRLIDRKAEASAFRAIKGYGLCDDPVYVNPENGLKITRFLEGVRPCDPNNERDLRKCMKKLRSFHELKLTVPHSFDIFSRIDYYEALWDGKASVFPDYLETKARIFLWRERLDLLPKEWCLTHIDAVCDNFLFYQSEGGKEELQLTDWEYAGMQDPHVDLAMFALYSEYDKQQLDHLIELYFEGDPGWRIRAKIYYYMAACGLLWSNWTEYKQHLGVDFGDYGAKQYAYAKEFMGYLSVVPGSFVASHKRDLTRGTVYA